MLETFEPQAFKFVRLAMLSGRATWSAPTVRQYRNPTLFNRRYRGSDPVAAQVLDAAAQTLSLCATDAFMDCPSRERAAWLGDSYITGPAVQAFAARSARRCCCGRGRLLRRRISGASKRCGPMNSVCTRRALWPAMLSNLNFPVVKNREQGTGNTERLTGGTTVPVV